MSGSSSGSSPSSSSRDPAEVEMQADGGRKRRPSRDSPASAHIDASGDDGQPPLKRRKTDVDAEMTKVVQDIAKVEAELERTNAAIEQAERQALAKEAAGDMAERDYWRDKERALRDKERALRDKERALREEKKRLQEKEAWLREEEHGPKPSVAPLVSAPELLAALRSFATRRTRGLCGTAAGQRLARPAVLPMPLCGRQDTVLALAQLVGQRFDALAADDDDKHTHVVAAFSAAPGAGKSRFLDEHVLVLQKLAGSDQWRISPDLRDLLVGGRWIQISITFNSQSPVQTGEVDAGRIWMGARLLHGYFAPQLAFHDFVAELDRVRVSRDIRSELAIELILADLRDLGEAPPAPANTEPNRRSGPTFAVFIAADECQLVDECIPRQEAQTSALSSALTSVSVLQQRTQSGAMVTLTCAALYRDTLVQTFRPSGPPCRLLPLPLLPLPVAEDLVEHMLGSEPLYPTHAEAVAWLRHRWRSLVYFRHQLALVAGLPRGIQFLMASALEVMAQCSPEKWVLGECGRAIEMLLCEKLFMQYQNKLNGSVQDLLLPILRLTLMRSVHSTRLLAPGVTAAGADRMGFVYAVKSKDNTVRLEIPLALLLAIPSRHQSGTSPLYRLLRWEEQSDDGSFETACADCLALLFYCESSDPDQLRLHDALAGATFVTSTGRVVSQEELTQSKELAPLLWSPLTNENVVASSLPVTAQLRTVVRLDEGDYFPDVLKRQDAPPALRQKPSSVVLRNAAKAPSADLFVPHQDGYVAVQCKRYDSASFDIDDVNAEYVKLIASIPDRSPEQLHASAAGAAGWPAMSSDAAKLLFGVIASCFVSLESKKERQSGAAGPSGSSERPVSPPLFFIIDRSNYLEVFGRSLGPLLGLRYFDANVNVSRSARLKQALLAAAKPLRSRRTGTGKKEQLAAEAAGKIIGQRQVAHFCSLDEVAVRVPEVKELLGDDAADVMRTNEFVL